MIEVFIGIVIFALGILSGIWLERNIRLPASSKDKLDIKELIKKPIIEGKVGVVKRPSAKQLWYRKNPKLKEEEDAMRKTLRDII